VVSLTCRDLSIVVVCHNHARYLSKCLQSINPELHASHHLEVFVVDNCSTDGSAALVRAEFPWVRLLENDHRHGFAANNNRAIRKSSGRYILILNPDTETPAGALEALLAFADGHPRAGICGPQIRFPDGQIQPSCRHFPTITSVLARRTLLRKFLRNSPLNGHHLMSGLDHSRTTIVDWMLGACLLVRREFLSEVGLMDEGYFLYVEDIDWCYRAHQADWEVWYFAETYIIHHHLALSDRQLFGRMSWYHLKSMWHYYLKHLAPSWARLHVMDERLP